jgi:hypothetical protein
VRRFTYLLKSPEETLSVDGKFVPDIHLNSLTAYFLFGSILSKQQLEVEFCCQHKSIIHNLKTTTLLFSLYQHTLMRNIIFMVTNITNHHAKQHL